MSTKATSAVRAMRGLTPSERLVMLSLADAAGATGAADLPVTTIAEDNELDRRTVQRTLRHLTDTDRISAEPTPANRPTIYHIPLPEGRQRAAVQGGSVPLSRAAERRPLSAAPYSPSGSSDPDDPTPETDQRENGSVVPPERATRARAHEALEEIDYAVLALKQRMALPGTRTARLTAVIRRGVTTDDIDYAIDQALENDAGSAAYVVRILERLAQDRKVQDGKATAATGRRGGAAPPGRNRAASPQGGTQLGLAGPGEVGDRADPAPPWANQYDTPPTEGLNEYRRRVALDREAEGASGGGTVPPADERARQDAREDG